ncbi:IMS domain-containing protein [Scytonema sp. NUACC26]
MAASEEQLRQAYGDRIMQLPRREYSHAAITSRKKLIEKAYLVLSDPRERKTYDKLYLAHAYGSDRHQDRTVAVETVARGNGDVELLNLNIEIAPDEFVGALLILQELGEYELVLKLGRPYLLSRNGTGKRYVNSEDSEENYTVELPDIILTVALACLELGREQWQQGHYENAAISLETGEELLAREGLFPSGRAEIQSDLNRLRPYRILELLALPEENITERTQGLQLLQKVLDERGGIDGSGNDQSGLNIDDFLRFIQQLRNYLTVTEQHQLFEAESQRPSAVATYLAVYASLARGFAQRQPALIRQAKQLLIRLSRRQDVHLEQSLCAMLLGQTEEATRVLELSQEYEALAFIREYSHDSPDLLPGLCLYGERWLQNDVFPHFRDLVDQPVSLKDYFSDPGVQAYLENLPTEEETTYESAGTYPQPSTQAQTNRRYQNGYHKSSPQNFRQSPTTRTPDVEQPQTRPEERQDNLRWSQLGYASPRSYGNVTRQAEPSVNSVPNTEYYARGTHQHINGTTNTTPSQSRRQVRQPTHLGYVSENSPLPSRRRRVRNRRAQLRLLWTILASAASIVVLWFVISTTIGFFKNLLSPSASLKGEQVSVALNQPPISIPDPTNEPQLPTGTLTEDKATEIVRAWLDIKAAAFGSEHDLSSLEHILVSPTLTKWRLWGQREKEKNRYRKYEHTVKVESLETNRTSQNQAAVEAAVTEATEFYENGEKKRSDKEKLRVRYDLIRVDDGWRIRDMSVLNKISMV